MAETPDEIQARRSRADALRRESELQIRNLLSQEGGAGFAADLARRQPQLQDVVQQQAARLRSEGVTVGVIPTFKSSGGISVTRQQGISGSVLQTSFVRQPGEVGSQRAILRARSARTEREAPIQQFGEIRTGLTARRVSEQSILKPTRIPVFEGLQSRAVPTLVRKFGGTSRRPSTVKGGLLRFAKRTREFGEAQEFQAQPSRAGGELELFSREKGVGTTVAAASGFVASGAEVIATPVQSLVVKPAKFIGGVLVATPGFLLGAVKEPKKTAAVVGVAGIGVLRAVRAKPGTLTGDIALGVGIGTGAVRGGIRAAKLVAKATTKGAQLVKVTTSAGEFAGPGKLGEIRVERSLLADVKVGKQRFQVSTTKPARSLAFTTEAGGEATGTIPFKITGGKRTLTGESRVSSVFTFGETKVLGRGVSETLIDVPKGRQLLSRRATAFKVTEVAEVEKFVVELPQAKQTVATSILRAETITKKIPDVFGEAKKISKARGAAKLTTGAEAQRILSAGKLESIGGGGIKFATKRVTTATDEFVFGKFQSELTDVGGKLIARRGFVSVGAPKSTGFLRTELVQAERLLKETGVPSKAPGKQSRGVILDSVSRALRGKRPLRFEAGIIKRKIVGEVKRKTISRRIKARIKKALPKREAKKLGSVTRTEITKGGVKIDVTRSFDTGKGKVSVQVPKALLRPAKKAEKAAQAQIVSLDVAFKQGATRGAALLASEQRQALVDPFVKPISPILKTIPSLRIGKLPKADVGGVFIEAPTKFRATVRLEQQPVGVLWGRGSGLIPPPGKLKGGRPRTVFIQEPGFSRGRAGGQRGRGTSIITPDVSVVNVPVIGVVQVPDKAVTPEGDIITEPRFDVGQKSRQEGGLSLDFVTGTTPRIPRFLSGGRQPVFTDGFFKLPPLISLPGGGFGFGRRTRAVTRPVKFLPSLVAIEQQITGKIPRRLTGLEVRPIAL